MNTRSKNYEQNVIRALPRHVRTQMGQLALAGYRFECVKEDEGLRYTRYWYAYRPDGKKVTHSGAMTMWGDLKSMIECVVRWDGAKLGIIEQGDLLGGLGK